MAKPEYERLYESLIVNDRVKNGVDFAPEAVDTGWGENDLIMPIRALTDEEFEATKKMIKFPRT
ncbi:MAG: hypothetical protein E5V91_19815 [Mesorhizobium sp.]|nr:MAG: hypothetical protein E5V91_19815 [Mesorhizobium sp.]